MVNNYCTSKHSTTCWHWLTCTRSRQIGGLEPHAKSSFFSFLLCKVPASRLSWEPPIFVASPLLCWYEYSRKCRMIYRGPGFFAVVWFGSSSPPSPLFPIRPQQVVFLSQSSCVFPVWLTDGRGCRGGGGGAKPYDRMKAWTSINHSILFGVQDPQNSTYIEHIHISGPYILPGTFLSGSVGPIQVLLFRSSDWYISPLARLLIGVLATKVFSSFPLFFRAATTVYCSSLESLHNFDRSDTSREIQWEVIVMSYLYIQFSWW